MNSQQLCDIVKQATAVVDNMASDTSATDMEEELSSSGEDTASMMDASSLSSTASWGETETVEAHVGYKKVLVTGGAGFIGSHVAEYLLERGDDVVIIDEM
jgi:UDP-glucuronate 4-epimerase